MVESESVVLCFVEEMKNLVGGEDEMAGFDVKWMTRKDHSQGFFFS